MMSTSPSLQRHVVYTQARSNDLHLPAYSLQNYEGRNKVYANVDQYSIEIQLDEEDSALVAGASQSYELMDYSQQMALSLKQDINAIFTELYERRYHKHRVFVERIWLDSERGGIVITFACLESLCADWDESELENLNDADKLAALIMRRDPPTFASTQLYEGPDGQPNICDIFRSFETAHRREKDWGARPYRNPDRSALDLLHGHHRPQCEKIISAVIFDEIGWGRLTSQAPAYKNLLNAKSGLGFVHGLPMFRVTPGSGFVPSGSLILIVTEEPMTLRGSPRSVHTMLNSCDAGIVHYYDYARSVHSGFRPSRIDI